MDFTYLPMILALFTLLVVLAFGIRSWLKMKKETKDNHDVHPEDKLRTKTTRSTYERTQQSSATHGTPPRQ